MSDKFWLKHNQVGLFKHWHAMELVFINIKRKQVAIYIFYLKIMSSLLNIIILTNAFLNFEEGNYNI